MKHRCASLSLLLVSLVSACGDGKGVWYGETKVTRTIDTNLPHDDPTSYPDNPVVTPPPVFPCPYKSISGCPDLGADGGSVDASGSPEANGSSEAQADDGSSGAQADGAMAE